MLNTDLHSTSIPDSKKMTLEEFVRNNRGIDEGGDPPRSFLEEIYGNIKREEIIMKERDMWESDVVTFIAPHKAGWLNKKTTKGTWKKHWFVLADSCLYVGRAKSLDGLDDWRGAKRRAVKTPAGPPWDPSNTPT